MAALVNLKNNVIDGIKTTIKDYFSLPHLLLPMLPSKLLSCDMNIVTRHMNPDAYHEVSIIMVAPFISKNSSECHLCFQFSTVIEVVTINRRS